MLMSINIQPRCVRVYLEHPVNENAPLSNYTAIKFGRTEGEDVCIGVHSLAGVMPHVDMLN